jgi:hypothetical protein
VRADEMDGMHVKIRKVRTAARRALNMKGEKGEPCDSRRFESKR